MSCVCLVYIIDFISVFVCILILLNGWGVFIFSLFDVYELLVLLVLILWGSVFFNFYVIFILFIVVYIIFVDKVYGFMVEEEKVFMYVEVN